jgi:SulP family sulfate permease
MTSTTIPSRSPPPQPTSDKPRRLLADFLQRHRPKSITCLLHEPYSRRDFAADLLAGLTVAVIALPLAMALGIASVPLSVADDLRALHPWLSPPAMGLYTAVIAGFIISLLGGSRVQIGGPTAAFIPIVFAIAAKHGYAGLATATLMAGVIVVLMGLFRFGSMIKFIPYPVTTGFTAGIAVTIFASQLKDLLGVSVIVDGKPAGLPAEFVPKMQVLMGSISLWSWQTTLIGFGTLAVLITMRRWAPRIPGAVVAVALATLAVHLLGWSRQTELYDAAGNHIRPLVETIQTRFGGIPSSLPAPHLPGGQGGLSFSLIRELIAPATTIALLCAIESLLSAVVADGMTGYRHRSDQELVAQGLANIASSLCFGLPATGAIARTAANIKNGGRTPLAGMIHAIILLGFMFALAPLAGQVPLTALAAVLIMVAWNIAEIDHFRSLLRAPRADVLVLLTTFALTVFADLTIGVGVGMVLASLLFMKRMAETTQMAGIREEIELGMETEHADPKDPARIQERKVPPGVEIFEVNGPFFFGVADKLKDTLSQLERPPKVFILRMRYVPHIDATGLHALEEFLHKCRRQHTHLLLGGVHMQPLFEMTKSGLIDRIGEQNVFDNLDDALTKARELLK